MTDMPYVHSLPSSVSFTGKGLLGYTFGPLRQKDIDVYQIEVEKGHDVFMVSKKITRTYYVLAGHGYFTIDNQRYDVSHGVLVEVPPNVEYCYSGKMTLLAFSKPGWFSGNDTFTKWNPDVVSRDGSNLIDRESWSTRLVRARFFGKSPISAYLRISQRLWDVLPASFTTLRPASSYGSFLHRLARTQNVRAQAFSTFFLRNRPELELIRRLLKSKSEGTAVRVAVLGCSTGAEAYSVAWRIRSARPDLKLVLSAMDISKQAVEVAKCGEYSLTTPQLTGTTIAERMTTGEMEELFDREANVVSVKSWIKEGITWYVGDAGDPTILDVPEAQDMVVANNFLCHMDAPEAERCLRNIARLVKPGGYLFVSGIDLDVRTKVASELGWKPVEELLEEIHEGDPCMRKIWPCHYGALEPLNKTVPEWRKRYAAVFQLASMASSEDVQRERELCDMSRAV
jgi:chemotaxis methyl-accepting protein methylase